MTRCLVVLALSLAVPAFAQSPTPASVQTAIQAARKVVQNANAALVKTPEYQALVDAQNALKAIEALIPVVAPTEKPKTP